MVAFFLFLFFISLAFAIPISHDSEFIFKDLSTYPASDSISGCSLKRRSLNCIVGHTDERIRMEECWSNIRKKGQKFAIFFPIDKNDPNNSYGDCIVYPCFLNSINLQESEKPEIFCIFWNDEDQAAQQNDGGLHIQLERRQNKDKHVVNMKRDKNNVNNNDYITWIPGYRKREEINDKISSFQVKRTKKVLNTNYISWIPPHRKRVEFDENSIKKQN